MEVEHRFSDVRIKYGGEIKGSTPVMCEVVTSLWGCKRGKVFAGLCGDARVHAFDRLSGLYTCIPAVLRGRNVNVGCKHRTAHLFPRLCCIVYVRHGGGQSACWVAERTLGTLAAALLCQRCVEALSGEQGCWRGWDGNCVLLGYNIASISDLRLGMEISSFSACAGCG